MFYTLFDLQEKEKKEKSKKKKDNKKASNLQKDKSPEDNYYGKGNKAYEFYNKKKVENNNEKYENTKNKIQLIVYKNGFILDDGPFRDRAIPQNNKFMEEVEKGNIPEEITEKGITDLGILLINRKTEIYYPPIPITPITQITQITQINPITVNPFNQFNPINQLNQSKGMDLFNSQNPYQYQQQPLQYQYQQQQLPYQFQQQQLPYQYQQQQQLPYHLQQQYQNLFQNSFNITDSYGNNIASRPRSKTQVWDLPPQTPIGTRNVRNNIFIPMTENRNNIIRNDRNTSSVPKKEINNAKNNNNYNKKTFETFHNFQRMEYIKE